ncbi:hypothetical protein SAMN04487895_101512 [Paenibacillus sophorae]|uniref:Uncharacterized protein n=1 Tax=Paenibacillus sophorae TaxID=1333845 RepID=A0A1H8GH06_9BACL|nr:hypothetical protein [Paenibacillus sophorae]QWU14222.1 hypothetical protein KP014_20130 [Paenibacillus sophorae]SEN43263.1 hypothetical protein SAMN04487895_101512 [Paenibacillus sophorae]
MKTVDPKYFINPEQHIPKGMYCYSEKKCPFWDIDESKPYQENGYCHLMKRGDDEDGGLLWDQVKECDINDEIDLSKGDDTYVD